MKSELIGITGENQVPINTALDGLSPLDRMSTANFKKDEGENDRTSLTSYDKSKNRFNFDIQNQNN